MADLGWVDISPRVNSEAEFSEIMNDFGNPLELLREAISNAIDAKASELHVRFSVPEIGGVKRLLIELEDNGTGMTRAVLERDFFGLGYSTSRGSRETIGEKGHGTKIYLRSQRVEVLTQSVEGTFEAVCESPLEALSSGRLHAPRFRNAKPFREGTGTRISIVGYNDNERSQFRQEIIRDYLLWYTKLGSIERVFGHDSLTGFKVHLQAIGSDPETISFGHVFPDETPDIHRLFETLGSQAADHYVKRFVYPRIQLPNHPEIFFDMVVSVEGDAAKRTYNKMIRDRRRSDTGKYRVADRYGLWLCKDYIPIEPVNDWITGFGSGSNAFVLLHAFVNCQELKLTANRKSFVNTDARVLDDLRAAVKSRIEEVDSYLQSQELYTLRTWQDEERTNQQEKSEFTRRVKSLRTRRVLDLDGRRLLEPRNESELFGLFITLSTLKPELFPFEPLDYNTTRGVDIIARNRSSSPITEGEHWYVELKHTLETRFNHSFQNLRYILCWDFDRSISTGAEFTGIGPEIRTLKVTEVDGAKLYFLDHPAAQHKIQIIRLPELLKTKLSLSFEPPVQQRAAT
jgi:hypothetical protein